MAKNRKTAFDNLKPGRKRKEVSMEAIDQVLAADETDVDVAVQRLVQYNIKFPENILNELRRHANKNGTYVKAIIMEALRDWLKKQAREN